LLAISLAIGMNSFLGFVASKAYSGALEEGVYKYSFWRDQTLKIKWVLRDQRKYFVFCLVADTYSLTPEGKDNKKDFPRVRAQILTYYNKQQRTKNKEQRHYTT